MLNIDQMLSDCRWELSRIDEAIRRLEEVSQAPRIRRGRKSMGNAERQDVSARMKKYWAGRRNTHGQLGCKARD